MKYETINPDMIAAACNIAVREREQSLSDREWKFRLRGYGYAIRDTEAGRMITSLLNGIDICSLPENRPLETPRYAA